MRRSSLSVVNSSHHFFRFHPDDFTADLDVDIDWPANVVYTCCTQFLDLDQMEQIVDPFTITPLNELPLGGCCEEISSLQDDHPLSNPSLFTWKGAVHLCLQEGAGSLIFQDLTSEDREVVRMTPKKDLGSDWEIRVSLSKFALNQPDC